jgi:hypothetical protein
LERDLFSGEMMRFKTICRFAEWGDTDGSPGEGVGDFFSVSLSAFRRLTLKWKNPLLTNHDVVWWSMPSLFLSSAAAL